MHYHILLFSQIVLNNLVLASVRDATLIINFLLLNLSGRYEMCHLLLKLNISCRVTLFELLGARAFFVLLRV